MNRSYTGVYVFGDSLVDGGNALKLAQTYDSLPFASFPDGAPSAARGYYLGRFSDGLTFADLISNKTIGVPTKPVFPFGFEDPWFGISNPFASDPKGNNLNFAYGGAQIRQGSESVPDLDDQTDAWRDAVDGHADPGALHLFTIGGNDVRELVTATGRIVDRSSARATLQKAANELIEEVRQVIEHGAKHVVVTGVPDIGTIPYYNGLVDEGARRAAATEYSTMLDTMIRAQLNKLPINGVDFKYISLTAATQDIIGDLTTAGLYDSTIPLSRSGLFFDAVHPTAQAHGLLAASLLDTIGGTLAGDVAPLTNADLALRGTISIAGEVDTLIFSLAANTTYSFEMLGISSGRPHGLESWQVLADPTLRLLGPDGALVAMDDDGGLGLDAHMQLTTSQAGSYTLELRGVGSLVGSYLVQAENHAGSLIPGGSGDTLADAAFAGAQRRSAELVTMAAVVGGLLLTPASAVTPMADEQSGASEPSTPEPAVAETMQTQPATSVTLVSAGDLFGEALPDQPSDAPSRLASLSEADAPVDLAEAAEREGPVVAFDLSAEPLAPVSSDVSPFAGLEMNWSQLMEALLQSSASVGSEPKVSVFEVASVHEAFADAMAGETADAIVEYFAGTEIGKPAAYAEGDSLVPVLFANMNGDISGDTVDVSLLSSVSFQFNDLSGLVIA
ncbi:MAG: SGNH/GDSL hydrolase family protein [Rhizorhabdus sp.]